MFGKRPGEAVARPVKPAPPPAAGGAPAIATRPQRVEPAPQPQPQAQVAEKPRAAGAPKQTFGFEQLQAAQGPIVAEQVVREQSEFYHATKMTIFNALLNTIDLSQLAQLDTKSASEEIRDIVAELVAIKNVTMSVVEQNQLVQDIINDVLGYGPLEPLLARDDIADIMVNGAGRVFIEVAGKVQLTNVRFRDNMQLMNICQRIVSQVGRRVDESSPICDARLPDGSRVNVIAPPLALDGPTLTIRKFKKDKLTMKNLVEFASISPEGARVLGVIGACRCNTLISGGTGSGKTTLLNTMTAFIDPTERVITCEDAAELQLQQPHVVRLETRPANLEGQGTITMRDLVKNCLRMRPERIIVGEVRGPEAFDLLQAMNTGHDGSMGTLHANSPREAISRLESMITMGGYGLPSKTIREMIVGSVDVIIQAARLRDGSRRITHVTEVVGLEGDVIITQDLFLYEITGEDAEGRVLGRHRSTGIARPRFWDRARYYGLERELGDALDAAGSMPPALLTILVAVLGFITVAGLGWAVVGGDNASAKAVKRAQGIVNRGDVSETGRVRKSAQSAPDQRRRQLLKTLKEQEKREKRARHSIASRLQQAGLGDKVRGFWIASAILGVIVGLLVILLRQPWWAALVLSAGAGLGLPRWAIGMLATRRVKAFTAAFPDAMDIITRGLRSGLPVHDCLKVIAKETPQPLCTEFQTLVENIGVGLSMEQALERMYESMPSAEVRFFSIVLAIQAKSGGNLAEALGNLSTVIRARKLMREKIKAMASEAIASAAIIGALPPGVIALISFTSPAYMVPLFTDQRGNLMLAGSAIWMSVGIFVMRRMINFKI